MPQLLEKGLKALGYNPSKEQLEQFDTFYELLIAWNNKMNLTGITDYEEVIIKHFLDSLNVAKVYDLDTCASMIDIGTGAGFPGIPIKIMHPNMTITLLDALNKRVQFMNYIIETLALTNIYATHERAENLGRQSNYREQYDLALSRAVSNLSTLSEFCLPFVKKEGYFIAYKSVQSDDEINEATNAITLLGGTIEKIKDEVITESTLERRYVFIKKTDYTPDKYPRKPGKPLKKPL